MITISPLGKFLPLSAVLAVALAPALSAQMISFNFSGTVTSVSDPGDLLPPDILIGTPFSGTVSYDVSNVFDFQPGSPTQGDYRFFGAAADDFFMSVALGGHTLSLNPAPPLPNTIEVTYDVNHTLNYLGRYVLLNGAQPPGNIVDWDANVVLFDNSATALDSDGLPLSVPNLEDFTSRELVFHAYNGADTYAVYGEITALHPVPEPSTISLAVLGAASVWLMRRRNSHRHTQTPRL